MKNQITLKIIGLVYVIIGLAAIINTVYYGNLSGILWFCYLAIILIGIGTFINNPYIILSQINIIALPSLFWILDFFYFAITKTPLTGITSYFFNPDFPILSKIISLQHLFTFPIALYILYLTKTKKSDKLSSISIILSFLTITIIFFLTKTLTLAESNINCAYKPCGNLSFNLIPYPLTWFLIFSIMIIITHYTLIKIMTKKHGRAKN